ncbi:MULTISPECIES: cytochrome b [Marichromatium]|uniref:Cytochrome b561 n=1 Tax=Marichromatium gracile TaxID=1048 RepID=A0A4R4A794_MARGR|nr:MULTISPECIES: cytochrome b [Marichromatium]MBO8085687.1 cytochrome b [Marichromatium sp.]MBK1710395.1 RNA methyltransferase [Marichromatium gracile]RNE90632.1 cytochrome b [Marichromatium sp. AB31]RNE92787.1 cytochrome b [Marichromatium sp. AB32]TCW34565.1 cytochrome b561 [Marichromatium gracile]
MRPDTPTRLSGNTIALHWIVAVMMIVLTLSGLYMEQAGVYALYPWHKSFGVLIVLFVALRVLWRIRNGWPAHVGRYTRIEQWLAKAVHWLLIIGTVLMPVSGFMMSALGGHGVSLFGLELVAPNPDPADPQQVVPINALLAQLGHWLHGLGGDLLIGAVALHLVGALKHHLIDRDGTLRRMLGAEVQVDG